MVVFVCMCGFVFECVDLACLCGVYVSDCVLLYVVFLRWCGCFFVVCAMLCDIA